MSTATKTQIDSEVEGGAVLLAEEVLPPSKGRLEKAKALGNVWRPFKATQDRIDRAIERQEDIAQELRAVPDEATRKKLSAERTALTGEIVHGPADFEAVAVPYAEALGQWANSAFQGAKFEIRRLSEEMYPLRRARGKIHHELNPEFVANKPTGENLKRLQGEFAELTEKIKALEEEGWKFEEVARAASGSVSKFGEAPDGRLFDASGRCRWVAGVRASISRRTTGLTGMSDVLKPGF